jgi:hypothetical protein
MPAAPKAEMVKSSRNDIANRLARRSAKGTRRTATRDRLRARYRAEDGQGMIELAIGVSVLLVIALVVVDFGKAINYWNAENHVANLAARYAAVGTLPTTGTCPNKATLTDYINCEVKLNSPELQPPYGGAHGVQTFTACVSIPNDAVGQPVTVKLTAGYNWLPLPALGGAFHFSDSNLSGQATMRIEQAPPASWATTTGACT